MYFLGFKVMFLDKYIYTGVQLLKIEHKSSKYNLK